MSERTHDGPGKGGEAPEQTASPTAEPATSLPDATLARVPQRAGAEGIRRAAMLRLQQGHGNAWVSRMVANKLMRQGDPAREAFVNRGVMPSAAGLDFQSSTGIGGFNVKYDPAGQRLSITLRVGIAFNNALTIDPATGVVTPATPDFAGMAALVTNNFPDVPARVAEVQSKWQWSNDQRTDWMSRYEALVEGAWGGQHHFVSDRWSDLFANVNVDVQVQAGHRPTDHCRATVFKVDESTSQTARSGPGAVVNSTTGAATGSTGTFTSAHLGAPFDFLNYSLRFPSGSASLQQAVSTSQEAPGDRGDRHLDKLIVDFQRARPGEGAPFTITGHASATGDPQRNLELSRRRAENVAQYLRAHGQRIASGRITTEAVGDQGATADPSWQRVDIRIGDGRAQITMAHETGHMFGLDDEYASPPGGIAPGAGTPGQIGTPTGHGALAAAMGGGVQTALFENNDNIMSVGNTVRPQHYATFLEALNRVATPERFHYGGPGHSPDVIPDLIGPDVVRPPGPPTAVA